MTIMYALGWTQHSIGSQMIRTGAMVQLLLGNIGIAGGGMNALRGHSNIQGLTDLGLMSDLLPGYMTLPQGARAGLRQIHRRARAEAAAPEPAELLAELPEVLRQLHEGVVGRRRDGREPLGLRLPAQARQAVRHAADVRADERRARSTATSARASIRSPRRRTRRRWMRALAKLKFLVIMDPLATETSEFWRNFGEHNDVDPSKIQTEVFRLPTTCFAEEDGSLVELRRWLQWHWKGAPPPGEARSDLEIMAGLFTRMRALYAEGRRHVPRPDRQACVAVRQSARARAPEELAQGIFRQGAQGSRRSEGSRPSCCARPASSSPASPSCATTAAPQAAAGSSAAHGTQAGNQMARRDNSDPTGIGQTLNWAWAWPANRRVLYNRASCDPTGKPFNPARKLVGWNGTAWGGADMPDFKARRGSGRRHGTFHHELPKASRASSRAAAWPKVRSPSITSRSRRRSRTIR